ncbi:hypothetical protein OQA88_10228 [Cercophora sp. LCS_1]
MYGIGPERQQPGVAPPRNQTLFSQARLRVVTTELNRWCWSGWEKANQLRYGVWRDYRIAAYDESPLSLDITKSESPTIDYIENDNVQVFLESKNTESLFKVVLSFTRGTYAPFTPLLPEATLAGTLSIFGVEWLLQHYPSRLATSLWTGEAPDGNSRVFLASTGFGIVNPVVVVTSYNPMTDQTKSLITSDLGAFDHFALLGVPSQVQEFRHPLLLQVLCLERSLEKLMCDLDYLNKETVYEHVVLNESFADGVCSLRAWSAGSRNRRATIQQSVDFFLQQLDTIEDWLPNNRLQQYQAATAEMRSRLQRVKECCISAEMFGQMINDRLCAWQDAAFRKAAQEDTRITHRVAELTRHDGSTMKLLAFLGTIFLPATIVSSVLSMPIFNWEAPSASGIMGDYFWVWWAAMLPLTIITVSITWFWTRYRIGSYKDKLDSDAGARARV